MILNAHVALKLFAVTFSLLLFMHSCLCTKLHTPVWCAVLVLGFSVAP